MTPYTKAIADAQEVMSDLIKLMSVCTDMKLFKNIAAVYVVWQHEKHALQLEELNYLQK